MSWVFVFWSFGFGLFGFSLVAMAYEVPLWIKAWNVKHRNEGNMNQALIPKLVPSLSDQPHVESKSRVNTKSICDVGITPRKTRIQIIK